MPLSGRQRASINVVGILAQRGLVFAVGLWMVPFVIGKLGKEQFGVYQLTLSVVNYLALFSLSMGPAINRYATHAFARNDAPALRTYLSSAFAATGLLATLAFLAGAAIAILWADDPRFGSGMGALLVLLAANVGVGFVRLPAHATLYARERLAEIDAIETCGDLVRAGAIVAALTWIATDLVWVGAASLGAGLVAAAISFAASYSTLRAAGLSPAAIDAGAIRELASFGVLGVTGALANLIVLASDSILIRWLYGPEGNALIAVFAVAAMWDPWVRRITRQLYGVLAPRMTLYASRGEDQSLRDLSLTTVRYTTGVVAPVCVLLAVVSHPLLELWVGSRFDAAELETASRVMKIVLATALLGLASAPVTNVFIAKAKLALPTAVGVAAAAAKVALTALFAVGLGWGLEGFAAATAAASLPAALVFRPLYFRHLTGTPVTALWTRGLLPGLCAALAAALPMGVAVRMWGVGSLWDLLLRLALGGLVYLGLATRWVVLAEDRRRILALVRRLLS